MGTTVTIQHSSTDSNSKVDVASVMVTDIEGQYLVSLDCSYSGRRVTVYVEYVTDGCTSDVAMMTTNECEIIKLDTMMITLTILFCSDGPGEMFT